MLYVRATFFCFQHDANFWHRVLIEAGWPSAGLLFNIKMNAKKKFKYQVKRLKRHQLYISRPPALASSKWGISGRKSDV